ncbi:hypothetical protein [Candidatus Uabimicrobium amorphum]|uniref:Uncharacterized protein n=1 Tax=Uabimicrobium amorphum TaxID=2596890 RepID=A0A5S9F260_UABAM|nr:hypothetical protein [Candidatus Uabimicrobium amorphum]BBM82119.1 hypothetical protein UABAM_00462 [Candidatus Uabimicrobium amorphum]
MSIFSWLFKKNSTTSSLELSPTSIVNTNIKQRPGWPPYQIASEFSPAQLNEIKDIVYLKTGFETKIEELTSEPYQRIVLLLLAKEICSESSEIDNIPLDKPLLEEDLPNFTPGEYGFDDLNLVSVTSTLEDLFSIEFTFTPQGGFPFKTVIELASLTKKLVAS